MPILNFDHNIAGSKTLWMLRFPHTNDNESQTQADGRPRVELLIPTPFDKNGWLLLKDSIDPKSLNALIQFEKMCEEATIRCQRQIGGVGGPLGLDGDPGDVVNIIRYFEDFLKNLKKSPPPSGESSDEPLDLP